MLEGAVDGKASTQTEEIRSNLNTLDTNFPYEYKRIEGRYTSRGFHAQMEVIAVHNIE